MPGGWYCRQVSEENCQPRATETSQEGQTVCQVVSFVGKKVKSSISLLPETCHKKVSFMTVCQVVGTVGKRVKSSISLLPDMSQEGQTVCQVVGTIGCSAVHHSPCTHLGFCLPCSLLMLMYCIPTVSSVISPTTVIKI